MIAALLDYHKLCSECCELFETIIRDHQISHPPDHGSEERRDKVFGGDNNGVVAFLYYQWAQALLEYALFLIPSASILPLDDGSPSVIGTSFIEHHDTASKNSLSDISSANSLERGFHRRMVEERRLVMMNLVESNDAASADLQERSSNSPSMRRRGKTGSILLDFSSNPILNPRSIDAFTEDIIQKREELMEKAAGILSAVTIDNPNVFEARLLISDLFFEQAALRSLEQFNVTVRQNIDGKLRESKQNDFDETFARAVSVLEELGTMDHDVEDYLGSDVTLQKDQRLAQIYMFWARAKSTQNGIEADKLYRSSISYWHRTLRRLDALRARARISDFEQILAVCQEMQNSNNLCTGFLVKQGSVVKNWKVRYACLSHNTLCYYEAKQRGAADDTKLKKRKGSLSTASFRKVTIHASSQYRQLSNRLKRDYPFMFEIDTSRRRFLFGVDGEISRDRWLRALQYVIQNNEFRSQRGQASSTDSRSFEEDTISDDSTVSPFSSAQFSDYG